MQIASNTVNRVPADAWELTCSDRYRDSADTISRRDGSTARYASLSSVLTDERLEAELAARQDRDPWRIVNLWLEDLRGRRTEGSAGAG